MHIYLYIHTHIHIYTYMYIYNVYIYIHVYTYVYLYTMRGAIGMNQCLRQSLDQWPCCRRCTSYACRPT